MSQGFLFASLSVFLYFLGFIPYIYHVFHGKVVPHPLSWSVWFILGAMNSFLFYITSGWNWALFPSIARTGALFVGAVVGWMMIRKIHITKIDIIALILALILAGVLRFIPITYSIIAMIIVDILILTPTLHKIWENPVSEDAFAWICIAFSQVCMVLALPFFTIENTLFWIYAILSNIFVALFIFFRMGYMSAHWFKYFWGSFAFKKKL